jgi:hypothetical protein
MLLVTYARGQFKILKRYFYDEYKVRNKREEYYSKKIHVPKSCPTVNKKRKMLLQVKSMIYL